MDQFEVWGKCLDYCKNLGDFFEEKSSVGKIEMLNKDVAKVFLVKLSNLIGN